MTRPDGQAGEDDRRHMAAALALSERNLGRTWPNPSVGCVLVREGRVMGRGVTGEGGRPHGEERALAHAGGRARGATAYVTLEPCAHRGRTETSCTDALIAAGIARVVAPVSDPDPRTSGAGFERMRKAGLTVDTGLMAPEARRLHAGFSSRVLKGRPLVTLKVAASLDGRSASADGTSKWITGEAARRAGHALRACHDAVAVGRGTLEADNPSLTCRLPGMEGRSPVRIVVDSALSVPSWSALAVTEGEAETWVVHGEAANAERAARLGDSGVRTVAAGQQDDGRVAPGPMLQALGRCGLTRLLVEGGPALATSLLRAGLVDRIAWFAAPALLGADGMAAVSSLGVDTLQDAGRWRVAERSAWGDDGLVILEAAEESCSPES